MPSASHSVRSLGNDGGALEVALADRLLDGVFEATIERLAAVAGKCLSEEVEDCLVAHRSRLSRGLLYAEFFSGVKLVLLWSCGFRHG